MSEPPAPAAPPSGAGRHGQCLDCNLMRDPGPEPLYEAPPKFPSYRNCEIINVWANVLGWQQITNAMLQCAEGSFNDGLE